MRNAGAWSAGVGYLLLAAAFVGWSGCGSSSGTTDGGGGNHGKGGASGVAGGGAGRGGAGGAAAAGGAGGSSGSSAGGGGGGSGGVIGTAGAAGGGGGSGGTAGTGGAAAAVGAAGSGGVTATAGTTGAAGSIGPGGRGGTAAAAGASGSGGAGGAAAAAGSGGSGGTGGVVQGCPSSVPPIRALISDFSDSNTPVAMGQIFVYGQPGPTNVVTGGAWHISVHTAGISAAQYAGVGIILDGNPERTICVDGTAYTGIKFTISGSSGGIGCTMQYAVSDSLHSQAAFTEDPRGTGTPADYPPQVAIPTLTATPVTLSVPFAGAGAPSGGSPAIDVDPMKLTRVQWQITLAAGTPNRCDVEMVLDDVAFY